MSELDALAEQIKAAVPGAVSESKIALGELTHRPGLEQPAPVEIVFVQELAHDPRRDSVAGRTQGVGNRLVAQVGPQQVRVLGAAGSVVVEHVAEGDVDIGQGN